MSGNKTIKTLAISLKILILVLSVLVFLFALFSGAGEYGGGFTGILKNSPNAIPWLVLFLFVFILWKRELAGGVLLCVFSIFTVFMFDVFDDNLGVFFIISLPLLAAGAFFIFYGIRIKN